MDPIDLREFGRLEAMVESQGREIGELKATVRAMSNKLDDLFELANRSRGGFWAGMTFVSAVSAIGGWFIQNFVHR